MSPILRKEQNEPNFFTKKLKKSNFYQVWFIRLRILSLNRPNKQFFQGLVNRGGAVVLGTQRVWSSPSGKVVFVKRG